MRIHAFLLSAAVAAIATPAVAQDMKPSDSATTQRQAQVTTGPTAAAAATDQTPINQGDIIVTATRRAERLSDVPIAVTAVSEAQLRNSGATDIRQMTQLTPSLLVSSTGSEANASARIRGIGTVGDNPGLESSVATFIDGVYRSRTGSGLNDLGEVDRIEVLRGPQGTLSGRNSTAGAINIYTKAPSFDLGGYAEATYGNYNGTRVAGAITGPVVKDVLAVRVDGVFNRRDGYYYDVVNKTDFNNRKRYFVRGQLLFTPTPDISFRVIGDYTYRKEKCCGAVYLDTREKIDPTPGAPGDYAINPAGNRIVAILKSLGGVLPSDGDPYNRQIANTPGRAYSDVTKDYGVSGELNWNLGKAQLTSITAYREYKSGGAADVDYSNVDISYRLDDGKAYRQFHTLSQELRLNGELFGDRLDWLVGGYYSHEKLRVVDNLRFGTQYGAFAACRIVATINPAAALQNPAASGCLSTAGRATLTPAVGPTVIAGIDRLSTLNDLGSTNDVYRQTSENYAFFTHNILKVTDTLSLTGGLRYTHEHKDFSAAFQNNNTVCPAQQAALSPLLSNAALASLVGGILTLTCTGNSTSTLNGKTISNSLSENELTGTGVVSYKPTKSLLVYASYSRGYKAGGYNLDKSDLGAAFLSSTTTVPDASQLRFDPETVHSYEAGIKFNLRQFTLNLAAFRSEFKNFQLNTFNGANFIVQNIGSCSTSLNGADTDASSTTGACTTGVKYGVLSQGVEVQAGLYPARNFSVSMGYTYANTHYRGDLVGSQTGEALDAGLFRLSGQQVSNAPKNVVTASTSWTPDIGSSGISGLFYVDTRVSSDYNTGSDLFIEKQQDGFVVTNARIGLRGPDQRWAIEFWAQNVFNTNYTQVAFNAPFQGSGNIAATQKFGTVGNQIFTAFLAEPRTFGATIRTRF